MQWLNKVDDALDWVLGSRVGPETTPQHDGENGDDVQKKKNRAPSDSFADQSTLARKSPVIIHEDYTCPTTPMAATVGEFLVIDDFELPYPASNNDNVTVEKSKKLLHAHVSAATIQTVSVDSQSFADNAKVGSSESHRGDEKPSKQSLQSKQAAAPSHPLNTNNGAWEPTTPRGVQSTSYTSSRLTITPRATPGVIRKKVRTQSVSPPPPSPSSSTAPSSPPPPLQTIESGPDSDGNDLIIQPILLSPINHSSIDVTRTSNAVAIEPTQPEVVAVSQFPPLPLSPLEPESNINEAQLSDIHIVDNKMEERGKGQFAESKIAESQTNDTERKDDDCHLRGSISSSRQAQEVGVDQTNVKKDNKHTEDDYESSSSSSDSFHSSNISRNSELTTDEIEEEEEEEADGESNFEKDYADFAIPFPTSSIIHDDDPVWDPSFNCYGIVHVRLLRAQRLPCDVDSTIYATLSLPPWKGRIRLPPRQAKRGPTGAGICSKWNTSIIKKANSGGVEEGESSPPSTSDVHDPCIYHMVHAYNNEDTPVPTISLELSVAKLGGVFEKFLCSVSLPCHRLMRSPGSWIRNWYPANTIFGVDEVEEGVDLDTLPFILLETCFEPKVDDAAEVTVSEEDDFVIRPSPQRLKHMSDSKYSSIDDESTSLISGITSRHVTATKPHLLRVRSFWAPAWCAVCAKLITTGWIHSSFECEACHIYCCRDCQLQVDVRIPCGSPLSKIALKNAQKYQLSLVQIMTTLAPHDSNGEKPLDGSGPDGTTNLVAVSGDQDLTRPIKGIGILNIRVLRACLFEKTYPSETEPSNVFHSDSSNLRSGDHYVRVSWLGSRDSKRTKTVLQASKPVFDSDNMVFDVPHYGMEYKVEVVDANTDHPVGSCLLSAQGLLQWQRDELLSNLDRMLLSFFQFRQYSEPRRLRLELRSGVKDGFGLNFYNSTKLTEGSDELSTSMQAGEISGWIELDLHLQEDRKLFYSLEPRRCPPKADEEFDIALIQLHIARISALVEDIQKIVSAYMYLVSWENEELTGAAMIFFVLFTLTFNLEYLGALPVGAIVLNMIYLAYLRITGRFKDRFISKEKEAVIESEKKIQKNHSINRPIGILNIGEIRAKHLKTRELGLPGSFYATISYDPVRYADENTKASLAKIDTSSTCSHQIGSTISPGMTSHPVWTNFQESADLMRFRYLLPDFQSLGSHLSQDDGEQSLKVVYPILQPLTEDDGIAPEEEEEVDGKQRSPIQLMPWEASHGAIVIQVRFSDVLGSLIFDNVLGEVVVPLAKLAGSRRAVEGWFRLLDVGTRDTVPGDSVEDTADDVVETESSFSKKGGNANKLPRIDLPEVYLKAKFSPNVGSLSPSDKESSKVICEELVRTASLSQENGVGVIGSSLSTLNTVRTLGGTLQNQLCFVVDTVEKARNAFNFSNPRITVVILFCLSVLWMILALIPTRIVVLIGGLAQFGATYYDKYMSQQKKKKNDVSSAVTDVGNVLDNMFLSIPTDEDLRRTYFWEARRVGERERKKYAMAKRQTRVEKLWKARWHGVLEMKEKREDTSEIQRSSERNNWSWKGVFALIEGHRFIWWRSEKHFDTGESPLGQIFFAGHSGLAGLSPLDLRELTKEEIPSVISIFGRGQQGQQKITVLAPSIEVKDSLENAVLFASSDAKAD